MQVSPERSSKEFGRAKLWKWIGLVALLLLAGAAVAARLLIDRAQPILRTRVIDALSNRFDGRVELASFQVSMLHGIEVSGNGLKIFGKTDPTLLNQAFKP